MKTNNKIKSNGNAVIRKWWSGDSWGGRSGKGSEKGVVGQGPFQREQQVSTSGSMLGTYREEAGVGEHAPYCPPFEATHATWSDAAFMPVRKDAPGLCCLARIWK